MTKINPGTAATLAHNTLTAQINAIIAGASGATKSQAESLLTLVDSNMQLIIDSSNHQVDELNELIDELDTDPCGGLLALPVADTLKRQDKDSRVAVTVPRDGLWQAQTPQMFRHGLLSQALAISSSADITDEASAIERLGLCPRLVRGDASNFKVTYAQDIRLAAALLSAGQN